MHVNLQVFKLQATLEGHTYHEVKGLALSHDGLFFISASNDRRLIVWDLQRLVQQRVLQGHNRGVTCVSISRDDRFAASGSWDGSILMWCIKTGACLRVIQRESIDYVNGVSFSSDGSSLASAGTGGLLVHRDVQGSSTTPTHTVTWHEDPMQSVMYTSTQLFFGCHSGSLRVLDVASGACIQLQRNQIGDQFLMAMSALSADGGMLISASWDGTLSLWGMLRGGSEWVCNLTLTGHTQAVTCVAVCGKWAVSGSEDTTVRVWDLTTGVCQKVMEGHTRAVLAVALSRDCSTAISGGSDCTVKIWRLYD